MKMDKSNYDSNGKLKMVFSKNASKTAPCPVLGNIGMEKNRRMEMPFMQWVVESCWNV
jgi:hypothetical protein